MPSIFTSKLYILISLSLTLDSLALAETEPQIKWVYGCTPADMSNGEAAWSKDCGWFDCDKVEPYQGGFDGNLCWAATAANMLHWWLNQNKDNLDRIGYDGPYNYRNANGASSPLNQSEIFDVFKTSPWSNTAGKAYKGINWFLNRSSDYKDSGGDYFLDILGSTYEPAKETYRGSYSITEFSNNLLSAFNSKTALGLSYTNMSGGAGHAVSIWGAEFNAENIVTALYISDNNNDQGPNSSSADIVKYTIVANESSIACIPNSIGTLTYKIAGLTTLGTSDQEWENYFASIPEPTSASLSLLALSSLLLRRRR